MLARERENSRSGATGYESEVVVDEEIGVRCRILGMLVKDVVGGGGDKKISSTATASLLLSLKPVSEIPLLLSNNGAKLLELRSSSGDAVTRQARAGNSKRKTGTHRYLDKTITKTCKIQQHSH